MLVWLVLVWLVLVWLALIRLVLLWLALLWLALIQLALIQLALIRLAGARRRSLLPLVLASCGWLTCSRPSRARPWPGAGDEPAQAGARRHDRAVSGIATLTPWLSDSSGSGSRCRSRSSADLPASRTL